MLSAVVFVPCAPLLVPELSGPLAYDTVEVRRACVDAVSATDARGVDHWVAVGASDRAVAGLVAERTTGSFARFGVDVEVAVGSPYPLAAPSQSQPSQSPSRMSLSMLIAGWLRARAGLGAMTTVSVGPGTPPAECGLLGAELRAAFDAAPERVGVLVVGDGSTALSDKAPGGGRRESAVALNAAIVAALGAGDTAALAALDPDTCAAEGVGGRVAWQVAAGMAAPDELAANLLYADLLYADAPFGVGYVVATWSVGPGRSTYAGGDR